MDGDSLIDDDFDYASSITGFTYDSLALTAGQGSLIEEIHDIGCDDDVMRSDLNQEAISITNDDHDNHDDHSVNGDSNRHDYNIEADDEKLPDTTTKLVVCTDTTSDNAEVSKKQATEEPSFDEIYYRDSKKAYNDGNYRFCLVLLNRMQEKGEEYVNMLANAAYALWLQDGNTRCDHHTLEKKISLELIQPFDKLSSELFFCDKGTSDLIMSSYGNLFGSNISNELIPVTQYLQLSHLYLAEGNLLGALTIMQLATARGYMHSTLVVLQSWTILRRVRVDHKESNEAITYLCSAIVQEERIKVEDGLMTSRDTTVYIAESNLKLHFVYLFSANHFFHLAKRTINEKSKNYFLDQFNSIMIEAYTLAKSVAPYKMSVFLWYNDAQMWYDMGMELERTPFSLLAEDAYFESFKRNSLSNTAIQRVVYLMTKYKRDIQSIRKLLEKSYREICKWNTFVRGAIREFEVRDGHHTFYGRTYVEIIDYEERLIKKVQNRIRYYLTKKHWDDKKKIHKAKKNYHLAMMSIAEKKFALAWDIDIKERFRWWKRRTELLKELKYASATILQTLHRKKNNMKWFAWYKYKVQRANFNFPTACQLIYDTKRYLMFKKWYNVMDLKRKNRSAYIISSVIIIHGRCKKLFEAMEVMTALLKIKKRHSNKRIFHCFQVIYKYRQKKHAKAHIRFWIRDIYTKLEERRLLNALQPRADKVMKLVDNNPKPRLRVMWVIWRLEMVRLREHQAKVRVAKLLRILFKRKLSRTKLRQKRVRKEGQNAIVRRFWFQYVGKSYLIWKKLKSARILQRFIRCTLARIKMKYRKRIKMRWNFMNNSKNHRTLHRILTFHFRKFVFLSLRDQHRASNRLIKFFRLVKLRAILRRHIVIKRRNVVLLYKIHHLHLKKKFIFFRDSAEMTRKLAILSPYFNTVGRNLKRQGFKMWIKNISQQNKVLGLYRIKVIDKMKTKFWDGGHISVRVLKMTEKEKSEQLQSIDFPVLRWEQPIKESMVLIDLKWLFQAHAFKIWIASYRLRVRYKRLGVRLLIPDIVSNYITTSQSRILWGERIVLACKQSLARIKVRRRMLRKRRHQEIIIRIQIRPICKTFGFLRLKTLSRIKARLILQYWCRGMIAVMKCNRIRAYNKRIYDAAKKVDSSNLQKLRMREVMRLIQYVYCLSHTQNNNAHSMSKPIFSSKTNGDLSLSGSHSSMIMTTTSSDDLFNSKLMKTKLLSNVTINHGNKISTIGKISRIAKKKHKIRMDGSVELMNVSDKKTNVVSVALHTIDFHSQAFHSYSFRLRQTGIFIFETLLASLTINEIQYFIQNAQTIFIQHVQTDAILMLSKYFKGNKIVFCGGSIDENDMSTIMSLFLQYNCVNNNSNAITYSMHFSDTKVPFYASQDFIRRVNTSIPSASHLCLSNVRELSVDSNSFGSLSIGLLLAAMKFNSSIEVLIIKLTPTSWLRSFGASLQYMSTNETLQELRLYGAPLGEEVIQGLYNGVVTGFKGLTILEICVSSSSPIVIETTEKIINSAKNRVYAGKRGLNVTMTGYV